MMGGPSRKIAMQKRDTKEKLSVTFTKRRTGLFHKAAELSRLCDAQVAVLVSAPNCKSYYSFSSSSVEAILDSFLAGRAPERVSERVTRDAHCLALEIESLEGTLRRATEFRKAADGSGGSPWEFLQNYKKSITTAEELHTLHDCLSKLRAKYNPCSRTASNVVPSVVSERGDVITCIGSSSSGYHANGWWREENNSHDRIFSELDPIECPQLGSNWISCAEVELESLWSDSNPNLQFLSLEN